MARDFFNFLKPKADLSRNGFDLSQRHLWTQKCGQVVPVLSIDCVAGDYHEIDLLGLTRTLPVETAAFTRMKLVYSAFFVPYQQLWNQWNEFIAQTDEDFSANPDGNLTYPERVPTVDLGALLSLIVQFYVEFKDDRETSKDMFGFSLAQNAVRMLDLLGYGSYYNLLAAVDDNNPQLAYNMAGYYDERYVNFFRVFAYQKICNDFFRSNQYTAANPMLFNADYAHSGNVGDIDERYAFDAVSHLWYCPWRKDLFTSLYASPQFGDVSFVDINGAMLTAEKTINGNTTPLTVENGTKSVFNLTNIPADPKNYKYNITNAIDVYSIRKAEALQKWKEDKLRAGNKLKDQSMAMFGTRPRYLMDHYSDFIGQVDSNISIDEVTNLASAETAELGELGGKGVGTINGKFKYRTEDFGVLMVTAHILPVQEYNAFMIDKQNTLAEPFDFFTPHFEDLGFEAVSQFQLSANPFVVGGGYDIDIRKTIGYAPRYSMYKTAVDKVHGEFQSSGHINEDEEGDTLGGSLAHWATPRRNVDSVTLSLTGMTQEFMYVNPHSVDTVFYLKADSKQDTDQFLFNVNFSVKSVRPMSVLGLPRW